ncbi:hypothetical protein FE782_09980 [Paenibacillus antri]|uniref:Integrase n=1 Tax=Paenibacillus antri TaxID=2582848 RepID=A0A5R9GG74_9BACL|nr:tyrosine-type recombinase/integrase [Paenibacillus antri]TLS52294.1 hypothetical protein FE782_09980 [Paenibacillus antri]
MDSIIESYRQYLKSQGKEENTIKAYVHEAVGFLGWCSVRNAGLSELSQAAFSEYRDALVGRGMKTATVNKSVSTLSTFFKWAQSHGLAGDNFARRLRLPASKKDEPPRWLTPEEEAALLDVVANESTVFQRVRNEALIAAMLYAGVKVEEVPQLPIGALRGGELDVYDDGVRVRTVPLSPFAFAKLDAWLRLRLASAKEVHVLSDALFVTERSGKMQPRAVQFVIETYSDKLGIPLSSQSLRNTFCRRLAEQGVPVERLKALAGHKTLLTTWKYYRQENKG